eukprot:TRINITY_DN158_c1_g1_i1.p1 TRINITY_DN158_c1_g1~~TRINITY_DN158_c1_g1_i1.p1  ORF type:complete len:351 (-),score=61.20 TRINITY_DN158_c1_g1_i1:72-1124(-)
MTPQIITHISKSLSITVYDVKWVPVSSKFVCVGSFPRGTGTIKVFDLNSDGNLKTIHEVEKPSAFKCSSFGASFVEQRHLATGDFEGKLSVWDLERTDAPVYSVNAHKEIIHSLDGIGGIIGSGAPEIVTGSRDGRVCVWDTRQKEKPVAFFERGKSDCWSVSFGNSYNADERMVVAGYDKGDLVMFDLRTNTPFWETNVGKGICGIEFDRKDIEMNKMIVTSLDSSFKIFDLRTKHPEKGFAALTTSAHESTVWTGRHLPQNREIFATTGGNGDFNLYKYSYPAHRRRKDPESKQDMGVAGTVSLLNSASLSSLPVVCLDWNVEKEGLCVVGSLDQSVKVLIVTKLDKV